MAEIKWIKITTDMFDDSKIKIIESMPDGDSLLIIWMKLMTLAGKINHDGMVYLTEEIAYTEDMLSVVFNRPLQTVRLALNTFKQLRMIEVDENQMIVLVNWEKHQNIDAMAKIREQTNERVRKHRELKKLQSSVSCSVTETQGNAIDKNKNRKEEEKNEKEKPSVIFSDDIINMTNHLIDLMKQNNPAVKIPKDLKKWHDAIRLMNERDGHSFQDIKRMIDFSQSNDFWKSNILSAPKLREKKDTLLLQSNQAQQPSRFSVSKNQRSKPIPAQETSTDVVSDEDYDAILKKYNL